MAPDNNRSSSGISRRSDSDNDIGKIEPVKVATREIQIRGTDKIIYIPDCIKGKDEVQKYVDENFNGKKFRKVKMKTQEGNEVYITVPNNLDSQIFFKEKYRSYYEHLKQINQSPRGKKVENK